MKFNWINVMAYTELQIRAFEEINELLKENISADEFKVRVQGICDLYNGACNTLTLEELENGQ